VTVGVLDGFDDGPSDNDGPEVGFFDGLALLDGKYDGMCDGSMDGLRDG